MALFHETPGEEWYRFERKLESLEYQLEYIHKENIEINKNLSILIELLSNKDK
tara:strand:- start:554 stop:712 length:159 start_codon:yes stop_codon:yes gene_type:complete